MSGSTSTARETADQSWKSWTLVGVVAIWLCVGAISLLSPDLISGSEQEHLPLAGFITWIWGLVGTIGYLWGMTKLRGSAERKRLWSGLTLAIVIIWGIAAVFGVSSPTWETGSDPTSVPAWALVLPLAAALVTVLASVIAGIFSQSPE